jgi:NADH-quinone oxidoreductase subunit H
VLVVAIKTLFITFLVVGVFAPLATWVERKQSAIMQDRVGANRADVAGMTLLGLFQPAADLLKLFAKEDFVPAGANRFLHAMAPVVAAVPVIIAFAVIPYGGTYTFGAATVSLVAADIDWGVLYILAVGSLAGYGAVLAGFASNNGWSVLGGVRSAAQTISSHVAMGLSLVPVFMVFGTLKLTDMALAQDATVRVLGFVENLGLAPALSPWMEWVRLPSWGIFLQPLAFVLFLTCIMAENKRPPFDAPEGGSELVAGYHTEYSGMRYGLFYMSEFVGVVVIAGLCTVLFLGGYAVPYLSQETLIGGISPLLGVGLATGVCVVLHVACFFAKVLVMIWFQMLIRWSFPRFRYDQVMNLCWKGILPLSIANIFATALVMLLRGSA